MFFMQKLHLVGNVNKGVQNETKRNDKKGFILINLIIKLNSKLVIKLTSILIKENA